MHPYQAKRAEAHFRKLDNAMLKDLLPQHNEDKKLAQRAKEARKELEEILVVRWKAITSRLIIGSSTRRPKREKEQK